MRSSALQKLLDRQKQNKFGDYIASDRWPELLHLINSRSAKFDDILTPLIQNHKIQDFSMYVATQEPVPSTLQILIQLIPNVPDINSFGELFKKLVLGYPQYQTQVIEQLLVRSFLITDSMIFAETIIEILKNAQHLSSLISSAIIKYFPQTQSPPQIQVRYLKNTLAICSASDNINVTVMGRIFQHLVALDCELMIMQSTNNVAEIDEDVADILGTQLQMFMEFLTNITSETFALLIQLFDLYLLDLPKASVVQYLLYYTSSLSQSNAETFIGFLLAKLINTDVGQRSRSNAVLYLQSLTVRANYIDDDFALTIMDYVANYSNCYSNHIQNEIPDQYKINVQTHSIYYYSVQCISYIFCWRWKNWSKRNIDPNKRWNLSHLLCNEMHAIDVIDKNISEMIKTYDFLNINNSMLVIDRISAWYPFDPCVLDTITPFVESSYINWSNEPVIDDDADDIDTLLDNELSRAYRRRDIYPPFKL